MASVDETIMMADYVSLSSKSDSAPDTSVRLNRDAVLHKASMATNSEKVPDNFEKPSHDAGPDDSPSAEANDDLCVAFSSLNLPVITREVTQDTCLAHLKLLFAFQNLKETIGYTDGLWGIYDSRVIPKDAAESSKSAELDDDTKKKLASLREKRWGIYVARAVDRYTAWWSSFEEDPLTEDDMVKQSVKYTKFFDPSEDPSVQWSSKTLPPLDVLMVWHAHMLNPRDYAEDCMRRGLRDLWHAGMPWKLVSDAISTTFEYKVSEDCIKLWNKYTGRHWDNTADSSRKTLPPCPRCGATNKVEWTTCGMAKEEYEESPDLVGHGYGDRDFDAVCRKCTFHYTRDFLEMTQFCFDVRRLLACKHPMPGTLLDIESGNASLVPRKLRRGYLPHERTFMNRLIRNHLRGQLHDPQPSSLHAVSMTIAKALRNGQVLQKVDGQPDIDVHREYKIGYRTSLYVRKMMSRYWGNSSPFALELGGAVMRQGIFTEKMYQIDWLHSPTARLTMSRNIMKYKRFCEIMGKYPKHIVVPTLDVDLAWHTHQLSPASYYASMVLQTGKFVDHDDKVGDTRLSKGFEWTSKVYQKMFLEVYSECTCWYCESVRASHTSNFKNSLPFKREKHKVAEKFHKSGDAALCSTDNSAHISAHNAVLAVNEQRAKVFQRLRARHEKKLEDNYKKAQKRALKKGYELPPRDEYYQQYWGATHRLYGPHVSPAYAVCSLFYDTTTVASGTGQYGACVAGTCAGTIAAGACAGKAVGQCGSGTSANCYPVHGYTTETYTMSIL